MQNLRFKICSLILSCICSFTLHTQEKDSIADAFKLKIKEATSDSIRINAKLDLAGRMALFNLDTAVVIVKDVQKEIKKLDENSAFYKKTKVTILRSLANAETTKENLADALEYQLQAVKYTSKIKDSIGLGEAYTGLSSIYLKLRDLPAAEKYIKLALKIQKNHSNPKQYSYSHIKYAHVLFMKKELDSAVKMFIRAKKIDTTKQKALTIDANLASVYKMQKKYDKALKINKRTLKLEDPKDYTQMGVRYGNLASTYGLLEDWKNGVKAVDSCIYFYKIIGKKRQLELAYKFKSEYLHHLKDYKEAYKAQALYKVYSDSVNNIAEQKRLNKLQLNYEFEKEKELAEVKAAAALESEASKKKLYFALLLITAILGLVIIYFIRKNNKQKLILAKNEIELKNIEKLKTNLVLANRENELKKVVLENTLTEDVLNTALEDIKTIIAINDENERQQALKSLSANLLSEKSTPKTTVHLQSYLDEVSMDFKVLLDTHFPELKPKEKELLCLMKLGLNSTEISKLQNTTQAAVKSSRYRIRKKLHLDSGEDIIAYIETKDDSKL